MKTFFKYIDPYILLMLGVVVTASVFPVRGQAAEVAGLITNAAIVLLFFLHGAKLPREAVIEGLKAFHLHAIVLGISFVLFPLIGLMVSLIVRPVLDPMLITGLVFLCILPSTVQSSIAFTSIAGGNVAAAVCSASLSNLLGIFITPLLAGILLNLHGESSLDAIQKIALQLFLPFVVGHLMRPWLKGFLAQHKSLVGRVDRGSILLVIYTAFSASVVDGLWQKVGASDLATLIALSAVVLGLVMGFSWWLSGRLGFSYADRLVVLFCGSKKSLASGVPISQTLFPASALGAVILPVIIFHQLQLIVCALLAPRLKSLGLRRTSSSKAADTVN
ncbi:MAG: bile acid:sodium symporter family protein [Asticcacaulis sp.]